MNHIFLEKTSGSLRHSEVKNDGGFGGKMGGIEEDRRHVQCCILVYM